MECNANAGYCGTKGIEHPLVTITSLSGSAWHYSVRSGVYMCVVCLLRGCVHEIPIVSARRLSPCDGLYWNCDWTLQIWKVEENICHYEMSDFCIQWKILHHFCTLWGLLLRHVSYMEVIYVFKSLHYAYIRIWKFESVLNEHVTAVTRFTV